MPRKLLIPTNSRLSALASRRVRQAGVTLLLSLLLALPLLAQDKQTLLNDAATAEKNGQLEKAEIAYCGLAKNDPAFNSKCKLYSDLANKERKNDADRLREAKGLVRQGALDDARQIFRNVKTDAAKAEAQDWLNNKIPALERDAAKAAQAEQQQKQQQQSADKVNRARDALNRQDFEGAKSMLSGVNTPEAQALLNQISQAEKNAASQRAQQQQQQAAAQAAADKAKQPGSISGHVHDTTGKAVVRANVMLENPSSGYRQNTATDGAGNFRFNGVPPGQYTIAATSNGRLLENKRVSVGPSENAVATFTAPAAPAGGEAPAGDSASLERAIGLFYKGAPDDLQQAEWILRGFPAKGKKKALSDFYVGAAMLARYYLAGGGKEQQSLYADAVAAFKSARKVAGFRPPQEISPKILRVYQQAR
ncbi:MAG: carboxypeptidase-like regulatory domain-containing protein [Terriglobales bacterium]